VAAFYQRCLNHKNGRSAHAYLTEQRGFSATTLQLFGLGYAPEQNTLETLATRKGWAKQLVIDLGLVRTSGDSPTSRTYDLMRHRIIVPIHDERGLPIGFGGRELPRPSAEMQDSGRRSGPKYLNSPETELFSKSNVLFNLHRAKREMVRQRSVLVVEGYMDVISLVQAGIQNVVGVLGTALTAEHIRLLARYCDQVILCFDSDQAGSKALMRTFEQAWPLQSVRLSAIEIPRPAKDPDEFLRQQGVDAMNALIRGARPLLQTVAENTTKGLAYRGDRIQAVRKHILGVINQCRNQTDRNAALRDLAETLGIEATALIRGSLSASGTPRGEQTNSHRPTDEPELKTEVLNQSPLLRVASAAELRFLVLLMHSQWDDLPASLLGVYSGLVGAEVTATIITLRALQTVLTPTGLATVDGFVSAIWKGAEPPLRLCGEGVVSPLGRTLNAIRTEDYQSLENLGASLRQLGRAGASTGRFDPTGDILSGSNLAFVKFLCRDAAHAVEERTTASQIAKILIGFEIAYLDRELAQWATADGMANLHEQDSSSASRYRRVLEERSKRLTLR
jgi:DNA primase catalytic core